MSSHRLGSGAEASLAASVLGTRDLAWRPVGEGTSGHGAAVVTARGGTRESAFVKWVRSPERATELRREVRVLEALQGVRGVPALLASADTALCAQALDPLPPGAWTGRDWTQACDVLAGVATRPLPQEGERPWTALFNAPADLLADRLGRALPGQAAVVDSLTRAYLQMRDWDDKDLAPAHRDTHPGNWVRTRAGWHLVDFEWAGYAPAGFDTAVLAAHLDRPAPTRAVWLRTAGVDQALACTVAGAYAARLGLLADATHPAHIAHRNAYLGPAVALHLSLSRVDGVVPPVRTDNLAHAHARHLPGPVPQALRPDP